jgi:hypothetical protein
MWAAFTGLLSLYFSIQTGSAYGSLLSIVALLIWSMLTSLAFTSVWLRRVSSPRRDIVTARELALRASKRARSDGVIRGDVRLVEPITPASEDVRPGGA